MRYISDLLSSGVGMGEIRVEGRKVAVCVRQL